MPGQDSQKSSWDPEARRRRWAEHEAARFERVMKYCRANFATARLEDVAEHVGLSPFHFHRWFSVMAGRTFKTVMTEMQLEHARAMLLGGTPISRVAERCGFAHQSHFTSRFSMYHGNSPGRWLRAQNGAAAQRRPAA